MDKFLAGIAVAGVFVFLLSITYGTAFSDGQDSIRESVLSDCATFNAFAYGDKVYDCKVRP